MAGTKFTDVYPEFAGHLDTHDALRTELAKVALSTLRAPMSFGDSPEHRADNRHLASLIADWCYDMADEMMARHLRKGTGK